MMDGIDRMDEGTAAELLRIGTAAMRQGPAPLLREIVDYLPFVRQMAARSSILLRCRYPGTLMFVAWTTVYAGGEPAHFN